MISKSSKTLYIYILLFSNSFLFNQGFCHADRTLEYSLPALIREDPVIIKAKLYVHIIKDNQGNGQLDNNNVDLGFDFLYNVFSNINIMFEIAEQDTIFSDFFHDTGFITARDSLLFSKFHYDGIDIYIGREDAQGVGYSFFPLTAVAFRGNEEEVPLMAHYVLSHEIGHIMGLAHTHKDNAPSNSSDVKERVVRVDENNCEANCETRGDLFCDTPSDPNIINSVNFSCIYSSNLVDPCNYSYEPDVYNIMSYTHMLCGTYFSDSQNQLMLYTMQNEPDIYATVINLSHIIGDLNIDLQLNIIDIILLVNVILDESSFSDYQVSIMDLNNDLLINIADIVTLVQIILNENY